jgi:hypothetical protein
MYGFMILRKVGNYGWTAKEIPAFTSRFLSMYVTIDMCLIKLDPKNVHIYRCGNRYLRKAFSEILTNDLSTLAVCSQTLHSVISLRSYIRQSAANVVFSQEHPTLIHLNYSN